MTRAVELTSPSSGWRGQVVAYGHWGMPVLVFPSEAGRAWDFENNGMVEALRWLLDAGRLKLYCVDSADSVTWSDRSLPLEERASRHSDYERWVLDQVVPFVHDDCGGLTPITTMGCSLGGFHAANIALRHAHVFPRAVCLSGTYDPSQWHPWGERGDAVYFHNPMDYVANPTRALPSTQAFAATLAAKGIPHDLDVWGHDTPHDWPSWQRQAVQHLPRFC
jgi:esterase/lipase superfamily enzyme